MFVGDGVVLAEIVDIKTLYENKQIELFNILLEEFENQRLFALYELLCSISEEEFLFEPGEIVNTNVKVKWLKLDINRTVFNINLLKERKHSVEEARKLLLFDLICSGLYNRVLAYIIYEMYYKDFTNEERKLYLNLIAEGKIGDELDFNGNINKVFTSPLIYPYEISEEDKNLIDRINKNSAEKFEYYHNGLFEEQSNFIIVGYLVISITYIAEKLNANIKSEKTKRRFVNKLISFMEFDAKSDNYDLLIVSDMLNCISRKQKEEVKKAKLESSMQMVKK